MGYNYGGTVTACYHAVGTVQGDSKTGGVVGYNEKDDTVTACYWESSLEVGIGGGKTGSYNKGSAYKIGNKGSNEEKTTWQTAMAAMNKALSGADWQYVEGTSGALPTLTKN